MSIWEAESSLDRVEERRAEADWVGELWTCPSARLLKVGDSAVATRADGSLDARPPTGEYDPERHHLLGLIEGSPWFSSWSAEAMTPLRSVMDGLPAAELQAAFTAAGLGAWHAGSHFCPSCGSRTRAVLGGQARRCTGCGSELYPRTDPAIIVAIVDPAGRLLLGRQPSWAPRRVSVFAGFVEMGESLEQGVRREMAEEVGVALTGVSYLGSQPWPFPRSLMVGFLARTEQIEVVPAAGEIETAQWFTVPQLRAAVSSGEVLLPSRTSIAHRMIQAWLSDELRT